MECHRKRFSDLQKIVLRVGLFHFAPGNEIDADYREVLERMGWQKHDIENCIAQYEEAMVDLDGECSVLEGEGILKRVEDKKGQMIGIKLTRFGAQLAMHTRSVVFAIPGLSADKLRAAFNYVTDGVKQTRRNQ
jgi:hypothetical protein